MDAKPVVAALLGLLCITSEAKAEWAWVRERVPLRRTWNSSPDSSTLVFSQGMLDANNIQWGISQNNCFTQPIKTAEWAKPPMCMPHKTEPDSILWCQVVFQAVPNSDITVSSDTVYFDTQYSWDGNLWFNTRPTILETGDDYQGFGENAIITPLPGTNSYEWKFRRSTNDVGGYPWKVGVGDNSANLINASDQFPFIRWSFAGDMLGRYECWVSHWKWVTGKPAYTRQNVQFRATGTQFALGYSDSSTWKVTAAKADTTAPFSMEGWQPLWACGDSAVTDTQGFLRVNLTAYRATSLNFDASLDTGYCKAQVSYDGKNWCDVPYGSGGGNFIQSVEKPAYQISGGGSLQTEFYSWTFGAQTGNLNALATQVASYWAFNRSSVFGFPLIRWIFQSSGAKSFKGEFQCFVDGYRLSVP